MPSFFPFPSTHCASFPLYLRHERQQFRQVLLVLRQPDAGEGERPLHRQGLAPVEAQERWGEGRRLLVVCCCVGGGVDSPWCGAGAAHEDAPVHPYITFKHRVSANGAVCRSCRAPAWFPANVA